MPGRGSAIEGTLFYMAIGIGFFMCLFLVGSIAHAMNPPKVGDIIPCDQVFNISTKTEFIDSLGFYEYTATFDNGKTYSLYDQAEYDAFPISGQIWARAISYRMRTGATIDSYLPVVAVSTQRNIGNECVITEVKAEPGGS